MKIALAQLNYVVGDFEHNTNKIIDAIRKCKSQQVDLVVFAELSICGYPPRDFLDFNDFIERSFASVKKIAAECTQIAAIVGAPTHNHHLKGKNLYNSAYLLAEGKIKARVNKALLPNYDIFEEYRYFEPSRHFACVELNGVKIALTVCEDIWNLTDNPLYISSPMESLIDEDPDLMINIAASPFNYNKHESRNKVLIANTTQYNLPLVYVNHTGAQAELIFDGNSCVLDNKGKVVNKCKIFEEDIMIVEFNKYERRFIDTESFIEVPISKTQLIHDALVLGIREYFNKMGFTKAILGLSGGIDSAITLVLAVKALGAENVYGVILPSEFSTEHSITDAINLANNLNCKYDVIQINDGYNAVIQSLKPKFGDLPFDVTEENMQARMRMIILMALANKFGYILLNTSNKSEAAVGYGTLYGDMCGAIAVLGDVYKTEVYELAHYINRETEIIPINSILKPPSAELHAGQMDSDSLPDYKLLDGILFRYIEMQQSPQDIIEAGFDEDIVTKVLRMVNKSEWKRHQTPPVLRVSTKAFGFGRHIPIAGKYLS